MVHSCRGSCSAGPGNVNEGAPDDQQCTPGDPDPGQPAIGATLTADGGQTILVIEVRGMPLDKIAFYGAGWQIHAENLAACLAGREHGDTGARWDELVPPYQDLAADVG
ncbi:MAG TPA: hypothetical protein VK284_03335 [Streptosporangiaceae bacterium]|nr:hypothetical protein [Streptosporangiaceae bacterium]